MDRTRAVLPDHVSTDPHLDGAGFRYVALNAWEQRFQRLLTPREETVGVPRLGRAGARRRALRQRVPVENNDPFKVRRERLRRCEASHPSSDDDGVLGDRLRHGRVSQTCSQQMRPKIRAAANRKRRAGALADVAHSSHPSPQPAS